MKKWTWRSKHVEVNKRSEHEEVNLSKWTSRSEHQEVNMKKWTRRSEHEELNIRGVKQ